MNNLSLKKTARFALGIVTAALATTATQAATTNSGAVQSAEQLYKQERAVCVEGRSHQDRETCLKEATNALAEARKNPSPTTDSAKLRSNALARCENVREADKAACKRLALGKGNESGSVKGGGIIKETVTTTIGPPIVLVPVQK